MLKKLSPGEFFAATADVSRVPRPPDETFVKLPYESAMIVAGQTRNALLAVCVELANRRFRLRQNPVLLGNTTLRRFGISHDAKIRALRQLEANGMVTIDWRGGNKTPRVTLFWP